MQGPAFVKIDGVSLVYRQAEEETLAVEDLNIDSIREIKAAYETGDLRPRLARYHRDVDNAFYGWNGAWLDPRFRDFDITGFLPEIAVPILALVRIVCDRQGGKLAALGALIEG